ncbi:Imidazoleglycerol-phosphate dehydratase, chloroplastic [Sesamum angolense]|uniref:Imidazoleglycerol-phosphate dehydratase, chloroplastic n=1 Tax=Sesamum angolense TaxID=2727404 RepID=A0AAE2BKB8_9LAMI|nr:Imidazoleglycerol-phosphate dehydratase, chloroplastic [Sesamum angolense]
MELSNPSSSLTGSFLPWSRLCNSRIHILQAPPVDSAIIRSFGGRIGEAKIVTKKTKVVVKINLGGRAVSETNTGIPFLDHMLDLLASHGLFDVHVKAVGDIISDDYYRTEDVGIAMGTALLQAVGDRKEISLYGDFSAPHDEALVQVSLALKQALGDRIGINQLGCFSTVLDDALVLVSLVDRNSVVVSGGVNVVFPFMRNIGILQYFLIQFLLKDLSGRPHLSYDLQIPRETIGTYDPQLVEHFFLSLVNTFGMTLHIRQSIFLNCWILNVISCWENSNHILEATFKAFARALRQATEYDARRHDSVPSIAFSVAARKVSTDFLDTALTILKVGYLEILYLLGNHKVVGEKYELARE